MNSNEVMNKSNFDAYLEEQMRDNAFAARFRQACQDWVVKRKGILPSDVQSIEHAQKCDRSKPDVESEPGSGEADVK